MTISINNLVPIGGPSSGKQLNFEDAIRGKLDLPRSKLAYYPETEDATLFVDNVLLNAAIPLFRYVDTLSEKGDPLSSQVRHHLTLAIQQFEQQVKLKGVPAITVLTIRYILCTVIDEFILNTTWGCENLWGAQTLLSIFHQDTMGGEKYFSILNRFLEDPALYIDALEFMLICINLGFLGKYRLEEEGEMKITQIREQLFRVIELFRRDRKQIKMPPHVITRKKRNNKYFWLKLLMGSAGILLLVFTVFKGILTYEKNTLEHQIQSLGTHLSLIITAQENQS